MTINIAKNVLKHEASAIKKMLNRLDRNFSKAIDLILKSKDPVIIIGMGKPAFIAQKISASLASTGTPSFTLHPADALHGDIGRISRKSVVILLSNSGETEEIVKILPPLEALKTHKIAITGNLRSTLAKNCEIVLDTSVASEAKPLNVAPTTSTTCMLAMGDAITMALVHKRKFQVKDFALLHPGGSLGRQLTLRVKDVMRKKSKNPCVNAKQSAEEVLMKITSAHAGSATVVDSKGLCIGIFTDGDLRRHFQRFLKNPKKPISTFMTKNPKIIKESELAIDSLKVFRKNKIDEIPVVDDKGKVTGLLDLQDLLLHGFVL